MATRHYQDGFFTQIHEYNINVRTREIYLHGYIDNIEEEPGVDYRMATNFIKNLYVLARQNNNPIIVHMHSIGGDWNDGMAIYDAIRGVKSPVIIVVYAHARSMTSIILQAADLRMMMPHADFMIHYGSFYIDETTIGSIAALEQLKNDNKTMLRLYSKRCIDGPYFNESINPKFNTVDKVEKFLDRKMKDHKEWYLDAESAVRYGFADHVLGNEFVLDDIVHSNIELKKEII